MFYCRIFVIFGLIYFASGTHMVQFLLTNDQTQDLDYDQDKPSWMGQYDQNCESVFIVPGWKNTAHDEAFVRLSEAYLDLPHNCFNTVRVNWPDAMNDNYAQAASAIVAIAEEVALFIRHLNRNSLLNRTELVGFSLGAHLVGLVGRTLTHLEEGPLVGDIIGLDPAGPGFTELFVPYAGERLQPTDAKVVVTLMTNAGCAGTTHKLGTVNFVANKGKFQFGCARSDCICSHHRAIDYFIEAIHSEQFVATSLDNERRLIFSRDVYNGTMKGDYYFYTNSDAPYAQGR